MISKKKILDLLHNCAPILFYMCKVAFFSSLLAYSVHLFDTQIVKTISIMVEAVPYWYANNDGFFWLIVVILLGILTSVSVEKMLVRYVNTVGRVADNPVTTLIISSTFFLLFLRQINPNFFTGLESADKLTPYIQLYVLVLLLFIGVRLVCKPIYVWLEELRLKEGGKETQSGLDIPDEPITYASEDLLHRGEFVRNFLSQIEKLSFDSSFVFALQGDWGEGKSSILNLLSRDLENSGKHLVMRFQPWFFSNTEQLLRGFLRDFELVINKTYLFPSFSGLIRKYKDLILFPLKTKYLVDFSFLMKEETLDEVKVRLSSMMANLDKKIVIFVDDLDRLSKEEALQILKMVKLISNFPNTVFVLSFDHQILNELLVKGREKNKYFLDKIVQKVMYLPKADQKDLDDYLEVCLKRLLDTVDVSENERTNGMKIFSEVYRTDTRRMFTTLRLIKRYVNSLRATVSSSVIKEVSLEDVLLIEVVRVLYPKVFEDIWVNRWYYESSNWDTEAMIMSPVKYVFKEVDVDKEIRAHIEKTIAKYSQAEQKTILSILSKIFLTVEKVFYKQNYDFSGSGGAYRANRRLAHPEIFRKYFMLRDRSDVLPDSDVRAFISLLNNTQTVEIKTKLKKALLEYKKQDKLVEFVDGIDMFYKEILQRAVEVTIQSCYEFARDTSLNFDEQDRLFVLVYRLVNEKIKPELIQKKIKRVVNEGSLRFAAKIVEWASSDEPAFWNIKQNVDKDKLKKTLDARLFRDLSRGKVNIFDTNSEDAITILACWGRTSKTGKTRMISYLKRLAKKENKLLVRIVSGYVVHWVRNYQIRYDDLIKDFDESYLYGELGKVNERELSSDERRAFKLFMKVYNERRIKTTELPAVVASSFENVPVIEVSISGVSSSQGKYTGSFVLRNVGKEGAVLEYLEITEVPRLSLEGRRILMSGDEVSVKVSLEGTNFRSGKVKNPVLDVVYRDINKRRFMSRYTIGMQKRADNLVNMSSLSGFQFEQL